MDSNYLKPEERRPRVEMRSMSFDRLNPVTEHSLKFNHFKALTSTLSQRLARNKKPVNRYTEDQLHEIYSQNDYYDLIKGFPEYEEIDIQSLVKLQSWFRHTIYKINLNFYYNRRSKYEYTNMMRFILILLDDMLTVVHSSRTWSETSPTNAQPTFQPSETVLTPEIVNRYYLLMKSYIQKMIDMYPTQFPPPVKPKNQAPSKTIKHDNIDNILVGIQNVSLTHEQDIVLQKRYIPHLVSLHQSRIKFKIMYYSINMSIHLLSIILPAMITIKDFYVSKDESDSDCNCKCTTNNDPDVLPGDVCPDRSNTRIEDALKYSSLMTSILMSILTNAVLFFKINQKYSTYTRFFDRMKQEIWKFISLSEKYDICKSTVSQDTIHSPTTAHATHVDVDFGIQIEPPSTMYQKMANHEVFQIFCNSMEELISNLNDAEFEFTLNNNNNNKNEDGSKDHANTRKYDYYNVGR